MLSAQLGLPAGSFTPPQGLGAARPSLPHPLAHCSSDHAQRLGHVGLFPAFLDQFPSLEPAGFLPDPGLFNIRTVHEADCLTSPCRCLAIYSRISNVRGNRRPNPRVNRQPGHEVQLVETESKLMAPSRGECMGSKTIPSCSYDLGVSGDDLSAATERHLIHVAHNDNWACPISASSGSLLDSVKGSTVPW